VVGQPPSRRSEYPFSIFRCNAEQRYLIVGGGHERGPRPQMRSTITTLAPRSRSSAPTPPPYATSPVRISSERGRVRSSIGMGPDYLVSTLRLSRRITSSTLTLYPRFDDKATRNAYERSARTGGRPRRLGGAYCGR